MSKQRAQEVLDSHSPFGQFEMTLRERLHVRSVWAGMPGCSSFYDALVRIARG